MWCDTCPPLARWFYQIPSHIVAEGLETALSLGMAFPTVSLASGLTAHHLSVMEIPPFYRRVMIAADNDTQALATGDEVLAFSRARLISTQ